MKADRKYYDQRQCCENCRYLWTELDGPACHNELREKRSTEDEEDGGRWGAWDEPKKTKDQQADPPDIWN